MDLIANILAACGNIQKGNAGAQNFAEEDASDIQLNAFEFRNYRTSLETQQHKLVERVVNQWCAMLVKGKTLKVNGFEEKVYMDKDLLTLEYNNEHYPLKAISEMRMEKDRDDMNDGVPWCLAVTFEGAMGDTGLRFNFEQERQRLNFALTLRILRTRDPTLDPSQTVSVIKEDDDEDEEEEKPTFGKIVNTQHYNTDAGIPIVFSVSDLKLFQKIQSSSRHCYLEFFVRYPRQDKFLYAKSPTTPLPQAVFLAEDLALRRKKEKKDELEEAEEKKAQEQKREVLGGEIPICAMRFELKNVKLKIPKVPTTIFGRLMAKDDYFPTAIGTFDFEIKRSFLSDRRTKRDETKKKGREEDGMRKDPETLPIPLMSSWKAPATADGEEKYTKIGLLTIRVIGYITDPPAKNNNNKASSSNKGEAEGDGGDGEGGNEEEEEDEEEEEEDEEEEG